MYAQFYSSAFLIGYKHKKAPQHGGAVYKREVSLAYCGCHIAFNGFAGAN
jgi:hypothetical protein